MVSVAGRVMLSRPQGKLAFAELRDSSGSVQLFALEKVTADFAGSPGSTSGTGSGPGARWCGPGGASCRSRWPSGCCWPRPAGRFGDKWRGVSDVETRYRQREVDLWANERSRRRSCCCAAGWSSGMRERLWAEGFVEVETPDPARHPRRRGGQALRHPPQRARRRPLPAHRARAVPEAAGGRRLREGVRDRPALPQRGPLAPPQPRVHDARALPGLRRLPRPDGAHRGAGGRPGPRPAGHRRSRPTRAARSTSPRRGAGPPWPS